MTRRFTSTLLAPVALALVAGCATVPRDAGFSAVEKTVSDRIGAKIHWTRGTEADKRITEEVRSLLSEPLTPEAAVQVALLRNENLQATYEELGIAQAELVEAGLISNPSLTGEVRFPKYDALPFQIEITKSFLDLLLLPVRKRAADAAFEAAKQRVTGEVLTTAAEAKAGFYRVQGAEQLIELRRGVVKATEASFEAAKRLHDAGNINDLRLAQERALHEQAKIDLARAEAESLSAREELNATLGLWGEETTWRVTPRLPDVPEREVDVAGLESLAIRQRPDLGALQSEVEQTAANLGLAGYSVIGEFGIGGHYEKDTDGAGTAGPSVTIPIPLFNQGQASVAGAEARLRQARRRYQALAVKVRADVRRARNALVAARRRADYYGRVIVPLRHEIVQGTQLQFNGMFIGVFELLQAKQEEVNAGREYVEALTEYWVARAELERLVGGSLKTTGAATTQPAETPTASPEPTPEPAHKHGV